MKKNRLTPLRAIRKECLDCSGFQPKEVRLCPATDCPLYPYRFGTNPTRKGIGGSKEGLAKARAVLSQKKKRRKEE